MSFIAECFSIFHKGGSVMYLILACSLLVVAIGVERQWYGRRRQWQCRGSYSTRKDAVQRWRFVPAKVRETGQSIACQTTMPVVFRLRA